MTAYALPNPYPAFFDTDGQPLENGYIWVGGVGLDPQTNPLAIFYDAALTIPAQQPLRTLNGYIARNGAPAKVFTNAADFSILVQDKNAQLVYTATEALAVIDAYSKAEVNSLLSNKANTADVNTALNTKANASDVYTKAQTYTKTEVDSALGTISGAGGSYRASVSISANTTLDVTHVGKIIKVSTASTTITLPAVASVTDGASIFLVSGFSTGTYTLAGNGSEQVGLGYIGTAPSLTVNANETVQITKINGAWVIVGGNIFQRIWLIQNSSLTPDGFIRMPNGLLLQWGQEILPPGTASRMVTFPTAFSSYWFIGMAAINSTTPSYAVSFDWLSNTTAQINMSSSSPASETIQWFAMGV